MPWDPIQLNDGREIPSIGFGTWKLGNGDGPISQVDQAISLGFSHVDTAQSYRNEAEAGTAIRDSGLARKEIFITTKYSGVDGLDIRTSIKNSLKNLGVSYVDLYLIHHPRLAVPDIPTAWKQMEEIKAQGLVKSIGVSNFEVSDLAILLASAEVKPVVNQILLHPYVYAHQLPILDYAAKHKIVIEAYSALIPITSLPHGPVDPPVSAIAERLGVSNDQVLLAWTKAKGAVVVTTSSKKERLLGYLNAGDLALTKDDIAAIDAAGAKGPPFVPFSRKTILRWMVGILVASFTGGMLSVCLEDILLQQRHKL
ncbi:Aldo/keto reductase [Mycena alexandri]|uniref:Aldo/keto reductase n=1 Tax=Mycena alexandri TaxID=1745969 RepID=A0AAD6TJC4_9AGAR|nr:Aldo/keto reductase [Mycena alexandri]